MGDLIDIPQELKDKNMQQYIESNKPEKPENHLRGSETISLDDGKRKDVNEKIKMEFMSDDALKSFVKKPTKEATQEENQFSNKSVEELKEQIKQEEVAAAQKFTVKDFEDISGFLIELIDTGISTGLRFWSGDTTSAPYEIPVSKKNMLKSQLTLILVKYQTKFSLEFMFLASIIIVYSIPFMKAREYRKNKKLDEQDELKAKREERLTIIKTAKDVNKKDEKAAKAKSSQSVRVSNDKVAVVIDNSGGNNNEDKKQYGDHDIIPPPDDIPADSIIGRKRTARGKGGVGK